MARGGWGALLLLAVAIGCAHAEPPTAPMTTATLDAPASTSAEGSDASTSDPPDACVDAKRYCDAARASGGNDRASTDSCRSLARTCREHGGTTTADGALPRPDGGADHGFFGEPTPRDGGVRDAHAPTRPRDKHDPGF